MQSCMQLGMVINLIIHIAPALTWRREVNAGALNEAM